MRNSILGVLATLAVVQVAFGQIETRDLAVETAPTNIEFPSGPGGVVTFKPCAEECDAPFERVMLSAATVYTLNGKAVNFNDFRQQFLLQRGNPDGYALVVYNVESSVVLAIRFRY